MYEINKTQLKLSELYLPSQQSPLYCEPQTHGDEAESTVPPFLQTRHVWFWNVSKAFERLQYSKQFSKLCGLTMTLQQKKRCLFCFWCPQLPVQLPQDLHGKTTQSSDPSDLHCSIVTTVSSAEQLITRNNITRNIVFKTDEIIWLKKKTQQIFSWYV